MNDPRSTTEFLLVQCRRYPALRPQDLLKALHQSVFGCGHFVTDEAAGLRLIQEELAACSAGENGPALEMLDGGFCRLHLRYLAQTGLTPDAAASLRPVCRSPRWEPFGAGGKAPPPAVSGPGGAAALLL